MTHGRFDSVVIGGGFYGSTVALALAGSGAKVALLESADDILQRASSTNQARVHTGYHYPRSILTGLRSRVNCRRFLDEFDDCIERGFRHYYAVARRHSNVTAGQFEAFCRRIDAPLREAPAAVRGWFDRRLIERVYEVDEWTFDANRLKARTFARLERAGIDVYLGTAARRISAAAGALAVDMASTGNGASDRLIADWVFNCTYARTNDLLRDSELEPVALRLELAEIALMEPPSELEQVGLTVVCGPFFSTLPCPSTGLHSLSHVRYTPHCAWQEGPDETPPSRRPEQRSSRFFHMVKDAGRYVPLLKGARYVRSWFDVKALLPESELSDSRPILIQRSRRLPGVVSILGGKIDNVYDLPGELAQLTRSDDSHAPLGQPVRFRSVVPARSARGD